MLRRGPTQLLSMLQQGSTISLRSSVDHTNIVIASKWRDDGTISLIQKVTERDFNIALKISKLPERLTSLGRAQPHVMVELVKDVRGIQEGSNVLNNDSSSNRRSTKIQGQGDVLSTTQFDLEAYDDFTGITDTSDSKYVRFEDQFEYSSSITLALEVPEKININCDLTHGGSVTVQNKIEGDVRINTSDGNILIPKLRGHSIDISALGIGNTIYSSDLLEAKTLSVCLPSTGRFRAKRIHASTCLIRMENAGDNVEMQDDDKPFDADDGGAICDISSLYVMAGATLDVQCTNDNRQAVRVKSNHGHVEVQVSAPLPRKVNPMSKETLPVVDMGGVNGSCEVHVDSTDGRSSRNDVVSCRAHFDSIAPDSVSILKANIGTIHVTMDRKVETDTRMLSCTQVAAVDIDTLLLDQDDEDIESLVSLLQSVDASSQPSAKDMIHVKTKAFTAKEELQYPPLKNASFIDGWLENKSDEPDSRFDRKLKGETGSVGKIRLDGASNQALQHFQSSGASTSGSNFVRPMVVIVGAGKIVLETLSWLGNIARRYGLDERRDKDDLGRTATRRGRSLHPSSYR